jgi:Tat protein translocase TatC
MTLTHILREVKLRFMWCFLSFFFTFCFCYNFSEELLFLLAKPFLLVFKANKYFISTQLTEALNTYITSSFIFSFVYCIPFFLYQIWCFLIPSCSLTQRQNCSRYILLSLFAFLCIFSTSFVFILPNVWLFLCSLSNTSSNLFIIQLQPKIYDFIMLTIRFMFLSCICSQIPVILLWLLELNKLLLQDCIKYRSSICFCCLLVSSLLTPPDFWCQLIACLFIFLVIEITFLYAFVRFHYHVRCH